jgi:hypothetical protein
VKQARRSRDRHQPALHGYWVRDKQRESEVLTNDDVALGYTPKLRPNDAGQCLARVHPAPIPCS